MLISLWAIGKLPKRAIRSWRVRDRGVAPIPVAPGATSAERVAYAGLRQVERAVRSGYDEIEFEADGPDFRLRFIARR